MFESIRNELRKIPQIFTDTINLLTVEQTQNEDIQRRLVISGMSESKAIKLVVLCREHGGDYESMKRLAQCSISGCVYHHDLIIINQSFHGMLNNVNILSAVISLSVEQRMPFNQFLNYFKLPFDWEVS